MRKFKVFLILIMVVISFQLAVDCLLFSFDQAEITSCSFQLREVEIFKLASHRIRIQKTELICLLFVLTCMFEFRFPDFIVTINRKSSILASELLNHSPPLFTSRV